MHRVPEGHQGGRRGMGVWWRERVGGRRRRRGLAGHRLLQGPRDRPGNLPLVGGRPGVGEGVRVRRGRQEYRYLAARRVEGEQARAARHLHRRAADDREARQPPQEHQQLLDAEMADGTPPGAQVRRVEALIERGSGQCGAMGRSQIGQPAGRGAGQRAGQSLVLEQSRHVGRAGSGEGRGAHHRVEPVAGAGEPPEPLDDVGVPAGHVPGQLLQDGQGPLAPAVVDGLGHVEAPPPRVEPVDQVRAEQAADVGDHPVVAGLDRLIGPQPVDAAADDGDLAADPVQQLPERPRGAGGVGVVRAVHRGQQGPQPLGVVLGVAVGDVSHCSAPPGS